jgi:CubicO group peptidase (beta-lactamase class C family)
VVLEQALGVRDPASGAAMTLDTIFRIYSMTKPVVSVAVMMLVEAGQLLISDPVSKYLPELAGLQVGVEETAEDGSKRLKLVPAVREMTVQDLLRHTSGLTYGIFGESLVKAMYREKGIERSSVTNAELVRGLATLPLAYQPGTVWEYSRSTDVLGALVERISGASLDVWLDQHILQPLGMKDSGFWVPPAKQHLIAEPFHPSSPAGAAWCRPRTTTCALHAC